MSAAAARTPRPDSLSARLAAYFRKHPDQELSTADIALKFDVQKGTIHVKLERAVASQLLKREDHTYGAGANIDSPDEEPAAPSSDRPPAHDPFGAAKRTTEAPKGYASPRHHIDISSLKVEVDVPLASSANKGASKWEPLFAKLTGPNQSIKFPAALRTALGAAALKRNREGKARYKVALISATEARIWRVA